MQSLDEPAALAILLLKVLKTGRPSEIIELDTGEAQGPERPVAPRSARGVLLVYPVLVTPNPPAPGLSLRVRRSELLELVARILDLTLDLLLELVETVLIERDAPVLLAHIERVDGL